MPNALSRRLGVSDFQPFGLSLPAVPKRRHELRLVHRIARASGEQSA